MADDENSGGGGAHKWMVTFGDAITLLLTFFVLLLTFSTPNEKDFGRMARGFFPGQGAPGIFDEPGQQTMANQAVMPPNAAIGSEAKPPIYRSITPDEIRRYHSELNVDSLPELKESMVVRVACRKLFTDQGKVSENGSLVLRDMARLLMSGPATVVVRSRPKGEGQKKPDPTRLSATIVHYLTEILPPNHARFRLSNDVELAPTSLKEGMCQFIILEG